MGPRSYDRGNLDAVVELKQGYLSFNGAAII